MGIVDKIKEALEPKIVMPKVYAIVLKHGDGALMIWTGIEYTFDRALGEAKENWKIEFPNKKLEGVTPYLHTQKDVEKELIRISGEASGLHGLGE